MIFFMCRKFNYLESEINVPIGACTLHLYSVNFVLDFLNQKPVKSIFFFETCYRPFDKINFYGIRSNQHLQLQIMCLYGDGKKIVEDLLMYLFGDNILSKIEFFEDNWTAPTIAAYGYGWEVRLFGLEIIQITYFKKFGGIVINEYAVLEITIGVERILMLLNKNKFLISNKVKYIIDFENNICNQSSFDLAHKMNEMIVLKCEKNYEKFLYLNNIFNILDCRLYFSECIKNMYLLEISKIFKIFFNDFICKTKVSS